VPEARGPWLWAFLLSFFLSQIFVRPGVAVADLLLLFCGCSMALAAWKLRQVPDWPAWLLLFWAWAILGGFLRSMRTPFGFSDLEFAKSLAKLTFYGLVAVLLAWGLSPVPWERRREMLLTLLSASGAFAILLYAAMLFWPRLPYDRFLPGSASTAYYFELRWFGDRSPESLLHQVFLRARGLSSEPSQLGYVQAMGLGFVWLGGRQPARFGLRALVVLVSILLTFSLTAYGLLAAATLLAAPRLFSGARWRPLAVALVLVLASAFIVPPVARTLYRAVVVRTSRLLEGKGDSSSHLRLVESWSMALRMAEDSPVLGAGLGNFEQGLAAVKQDLPDRELLGPETQGWNVLAHVLAVTGVVGLLLFLLFLAELVPGHARLATLFLLGCLVQGSFLAAPFWVSWVLYLEPTLKTPDPG
jgi:O-antigen ligase